MQAKATTAATLSSPADYREKSSDVHRPGEHSPGLDASSLEDNSGTNRITFSGNVSSSDVTHLPANAKFDPLRDKTGTFLMAPGFAVSFGGNFNTLNGTIAANGVDFSGNAGGTINGSVINYSQESLTFQGNSDLYFNRSNASSNPAGFIPKIILTFDPTSYDEGPF